MWQKIPLTRAKSTKEPSRIPRRRGFKTVFKEIAPAGTTDFTSILVKLKAADPDVIYVSSFTPFGVTFKKQAKEFGLKPREWHFTHFDKSFTGALGKDANYVTGEHRWLTGMTTAI